MEYTTEVEHALIVRDLARVFTGYAAGEASLWRALSLINAIATDIKPEVTLQYPVVRYIRNKDPQLWYRLKPYVKGWK